MTKISIFIQVILKLFKMIFVKLYCDAEINYSINK